MAKIIDSAISVVCGVVLIIGAHSMLKAENDNIFDNVQQKIDNSKKQILESLATLKNILQSKSEQLPTMCCNAQGAPQSPQIALDPSLIDHLNGLIFTIKKYENNINCMEDWVHLIEELACEPVPSQQDVTAYANALTKLAENLIELIRCARCGECDVSMPEDVLHILNEINCLIDGLDRPTIDLNIE